MSKIFMIVLEYIIWEGTRLIFTKTPGHDFSNTELLSPQI